ncbi:unnamed protein product, partial [Sphagnum jensenii]
MIGCYQSPFSLIQPSTNLSAILSNVALSLSYMFSGHIPVQQMNAGAYHLTKGLGGGIHCLCSLIRIC